MSLIRGKTEVHFNGKYLGTMADSVTELKESIEFKQRDMVLALAKPGQQLVNEITPDKAHLNHMCLGIAGEVGELIDCVKKHTIYGKPLDLANLMEEVGDLLFYTVGILNLTGMNMFECMAHNQAKLAERYKNHVYSDQAAIDRADKQGE
jgi:NTP pyrophosphatase (non-canonical NTP hydrolase)